MRRAVGACLENRDDFISYYFTRSGAAAFAPPLSPFLIRSFELFCYLLLCDFFLLKNV